jgi:hypothetical protein
MPSSTASAGHWKKKTRQGHLRRAPGRRLVHVEYLSLGAWINNQRARDATLRENPREHLSAFGMRWA